MRGNLKKKGTQLMISTTRIPSLELGVTRRTPTNYGKKIHVRYERHRQGAVIIYDNGRRLGQARLLNAVANGLARRREQ